MNTNGKQDNKHTMSHGFMIFAVDGATAPISNAGKVFGKLGLGANNNPNYAKAFRSKINAAAINYMWVSVFPSKSKGINSATTTWEITEVEFAALSEFNAPSMPT
jgi:hypothetical protein